MPAWPLPFAQALPGPSFWDKAVDLSPVTAIVFVALCIVVAAFVWAFRRMVASNQETVSNFLAHIESSDAARDRALREISASCHAVQESLVGRVEAQFGRTNAVLDQNVLALGRADALTDEVRMLRQDHARFHRDSQDAHQYTRHALRDLANAAGLKALEEKYAHQITGLPPGCSVVETLPPAAEVPPAGEPS